MPDERLGLVIGLGLLIWMAMRNVHIVVTAVLASLVVAVLSALNPLEAMTGPYLQAFADYIASFFPIFLLRAVFGKFRVKQERPRPSPTGSASGSGPPTPCSPSCSPAPS